MVGQVSGRHQAKAGGSWAMVALPIAPQMVTSSGGGGAGLLPGCQAGGMEEQMRGGTRPRCQVGLLSWGHEPGPDPQGPHLCTNSFPRPLIFTYSPVSAKPPGHLLYLFKTDNYLKPN